MKKKNVLVFPAGTEIGLEIHAALRDCKDIQLFGAGQNISNHAPFVYREYNHLPSIHEVGWLAALIDLCRTLSIDYIFPAYDDVIVALSQHRQEIPACIIAPSNDACEITRSKALTYQKLAPFLRVPHTYDDISQVEKYPVFVKPNRGQGSFGTHKVNNHKELRQACATLIDPIISEYLPGEEYTVDCFSDRQRGVLFAHARSRQRVRNGISVNSVSIHLDEALVFARKIHAALHLYGAWFFQLKRAADGELALLEVAPRIAGTMATHRVTGINFPLLSIYEAERLPLSILTNAHSIELDRALSNRYKHNIQFSTLYVDLDDTLILDGKVNTRIISLIFQSLNQGKKVKLITRHSQDLPTTLRQHRLDGLFDAVIHLTNKEPKSSYIHEKDAIFIDDSFAERREVFLARGIPTFDCSMVELLIQQKQYQNL